jgi:hypothetical protein
MQTQPFANEKFKEDAMSDILGTLAKTRRRFVPGRPAEYLALKLAKKLSDTEAVRYYSTLLDRHPEHLLLRVFRECAERGTLTGKEFISRLRQLTMSES